MAKKTHGFYIYPRLDSRTDKIYFQGRNLKMHFAGKTNPEEGIDRYIFSSAKDVLWPEAWEKFKQDMIAILRHMAEINKVGEITKVFSPLMVVYGPQD